MSDTTTTAAAWPEGVVARYLTVAGTALGRADITTDVHRGGTVQCHCGHSRGPLAHLAKKAAADHAEDCRALPKPVG